MGRAYKTLLRLYPRDYRALFAAEMLAAFEEAAEERRRRGGAVFAGFALAELIGLVMGARAEWVAKFTHSIHHSNSYIRGRCLPDRLMMRPAGVSWESYYGWQTGRVQAIDLTGESGACVNAHQRFVFASSLRRLVIFMCGDSFPCIHRAAPTPRARTSQD